MSTRAMIGIKNRKGTIRGIYCHCDGFPRHLGATLLLHYGNREKTASLIEMGDLSCIHSDGLPQITHRTDDRGPREYRDEAAFKADGNERMVEWLYLWDGYWTWTDDVEWVKAIAVKLNRLNA